MKIKVIILALLFMLITKTGMLSAATIYYGVNGDSSMTFTINFDQSYSDVSENIINNELIISFNTFEIFSFEKQEFFDLPVDSVWLTTDGLIKKIHFRFENNIIIKPIIKEEERKLSLEFISTIENSNNKDSKLSPSYGAYFRMFFGLGSILFIIFISYFAIRYMFRNNVISDIPGVGRLLGKVNIDIKHKLIFYELGNTIYIISSNDNHTSLIDKITDEEQITIIKSGFTNKKDFSSYMKIFKNKEDISKDLQDITKEIKGTASSLKKK